MTLYQLKPTFQKLLRPAVVGLVRAGMRPNDVTVAAVGLSIVSGAILSLHAPDVRWLWILSPVLLVRLALNVMDGLMAQEHRLTSDLGFFLNELGDVASDAALYLPLALYTNAPAALVVVFVLLAMMVEMAGLVSLQVRASRRYDGPLGKTDRAAVVGILSVTLAAGVPPGFGWALVWVVLDVLLVITLIRRVKFALLNRRPGP